MTPRFQLAAVTATCLVAAMAYAGAVTAFALVAYVLPGVLGAALLASFLVAHRMSAAAVIVGGLLVLGWSELVNIWSGTADGPVARSTAAAAACAVLAVVVARSSFPAAFLGPVAGSVGGALLLGAGSQVRSVAVATAVCAALTLGWIERSRRNWTVSPRSGAATVLLSLLVGAVAAAVVLLQTQRDLRPPEALAAGQAYPRIKAPWNDPLGTYTIRQGAPPSRANEAAPPSASYAASRSRVRSPSHRSSPPATHPRPPAGARHSPPPKARHHASAQAAKHAAKAPQSSAWSYVLAGILLFLLALVLVLAGRLLAVRLAWRRLRRRLAAGAPAEQVTGAWAWARLRLEACRLPLPAAVSPDAVVAGRAVEDLPAEVLTPLQRLATWTTAAAFANERMAGADVVAAWKAAGQTEASARERMPRRARVCLALRGPAPSARTA